MRITNITFLRHPLQLGVGDLHDHKYNGTSIRTTMSELSNYASDSRYVGLPIDDEACTFTFEVYPSDEMKEGKVLMLLYKSRRF